MSSTTLTVLSVILAVVIIAVLAGALIMIRASLSSASQKLATLAGALEGVEAEHLRPLEPAVKAINASLDACIPLKFTNGLRGALAGRPIAIRYVDNRELNKPQDKP